MRYQLSGTVMQTVEIDLDAGESVYSQTSCMCWMDPSITMDTHTGGGLLAGLKRSFSGGTLFITAFTAAAGGGHVVKNLVFGGEGLFLATLTGPGRVVLQSMPILNLAEEIGRYLPMRVESNGGSVSFNND